jgi:2-polyprenyl-3-methyl-5-hydroxy-6-metoxy-1,4-benzoquinol methylase
MTKEASSQHSLSTYVRKAARKGAYLLRSGYWHSGESCCADFPDENFTNHLKVYKFAAQLCSGKDVLDVGCGTGYGAQFLANSARSVIGIDLSRQAIRYANGRYLDSNIRFLRMDAEQLKFGDRSFDFVISSENFEHLHDQRANLREISRILRDEGMLLLATPNREMFLEIDNPYHTHEVGYEELLEMVRESYCDCLIAENLLESPTIAGRRMRADRKTRRAEGIDLMKAPFLWGQHIDTTWVSNTHSFLCFSRHPVREPSARQEARRFVQSKG